MASRGRETARLLTHPVAVGALALLTVNDHLLKEQLGGPVTGKLSDLAGVVLLAWLLGVLTRWPRAAAVVVAAAFVALKTLPRTAELAAPVLGGVTLRDPTDLVVLPVLLPSALVLRRLLARPARLDDADPRAARTLLAISVTALATLAVTATSCAPAATVTDLQVGGGVVALRTVTTSGPGASTATSSDRSDASSGAMSSGARPAPRNDWFVSRDGGRTWEAAAAPTAARRATDQTCAPDLGCLRVVDRRRVERRAPGATGWRSEVEFTDEDRRRAALRDRPCSMRSGVLDLKGVVVARTAAGSAAVVGAGGQGVLRRDVDGRWHRQAVGGCSPVPLTGPSQVAALRYTPLLLLPGAVLLVVLGALRGRTARGVVAGVLLVALAVGLGLLALVLGFVEVDYVVSGVALPVLSVIAFALCWLVLGGSPARSVTAPEARPRA